MVELTKAGTMRSFWNAILARRLARPASPVGRRRGRPAGPSIAVLLALAGTGLATVFAATASAMPPPIPPPAPGVAPGTAVEASISGPPMVYVDMVYTATDGTVWLTEGVGSGGPPVPLGGHLVSGPAPVWTGSVLLVFGQGTDNQLWYRPFGSAASWTSLGGRLTSKPGAVSLGGGAYAVFVRGTDGGVWQRTYTGTVWEPWQRAGGRVLSGTGPTAAYLTGTGHIYVGVVGTDGQMYLKVANLTGGFFSIGGRTTASPALTAISPSALVAFSRGTNGAGYDNQVTEGEGLTGWQSMGGRLTSGLAASSGLGAGKTTTYTFGLGTDNQVYQKVGSWASYPPSFSGWTQETG